MGRQEAHSPEEQAQHRVSGHSNGAIHPVLAHAPLPSVLEVIPDGVSIYDITGRVVYSNRAARRLLGKTDPALVDATSKERFERLKLFDANGVRIPIESWAVVRLTHGETIPYERPETIYFTNSDDVMMKVNISGAPIFGPDGEQLGAMIVSSDVTEEWRRQRDQQDLEQREKEAHSASERAARELERLQMTLDMALMRLSLDEMLDELLQRAESALKTDTATLLLADESEQALRVRASRGPAGESLDSQRVAVGEGFAGHIAATRKPDTIPDTSQAPNGYSHTQLKSIMGVPLLVSDRLLGVLHVGTLEQREFSPGDIWLLQQIADRAALAIDRAQLYDQLQRAHAQSSAQARQQEALIEALTEGVILYSPSGEALLANSAYRRMLGMSPDGRELSNEFAQRGYLVQPRSPTGDPLPQEEWAASRLMRGEILDSEHSQDIWLRGYDGHDALYSATGGPVTDEHGAVVGAVMALRDVTMHRRMEMEAHARSAELEAIFESMTDGLLVHAPDGSLIRINNSARTLLNMPSDALRDATDSVDITCFITFLDESGAPLPADQWPAARVLRGESLEGVMSTPLLARMADGRERLLTIAGAPMREANGGILGAVLVARDVTELRTLEGRTQSALEALLDMAQSAMTVGAAEDYDRSIAESSTRLMKLTQRVLGCQRASLTVRDQETGALHAVAVIGLSKGKEKEWWARQVAEERRGSRVEDWPIPGLADKLLRGETVVIDLRSPEYRSLPNPYNIRNMLLTPMMLFQRCVGFLALDYDGQSHEFTEGDLRLASAVSTLCALVIERARMQREQATAEAQNLALGQANHRMNEFLSIAAHELRTPITVIKANLQMLRRRANQAGKGGSLAGQPSGQTNELLARTERSLTRLTRLVDDLLDVSRVRAGKLEMRIEPVDLREVVADAIEEQRLSTHDRVISLEIDAPNGAPTLADPERISQVINNYLTNALKYSTAKAPVRVRLEIVGDSARVSVTDQGPGIAPEEQDQVWELFHRSATVEVLSGSGVGLGLGLHLCKTIVERHGGAVGMSSRPGAGSTFWFTLPLQAATEP